MRGKIIYFMMRDQVSKKGVAELVACCFAKVTLGKGQSFVQESCRVGTVNSFYSKTQVAYGEFRRAQSNHIHNEGRTYAYSACTQLSLSGTRG